VIGEQPLAGSLVHHCGPFGGDFISKQPMDSHKSSTIAINSRLLKPYRRAAKLLGVPVEYLVEEFLSAFTGEPDQLGEELRWISYATRERALAAAERFETFAVEQKLRGNSDIGMVAAKVLQHDGHWKVIPDYLSRPTEALGKGLRRISGKKRTRPEKTTKFPAFAPTRCRRPETSGLTCRTILPS
jgi:hypothetical protein